MTITHALLDEGFAEINPWPDDETGRMKEPARAELAALLGDDIPDRPLRKAEFLDLLARARAMLGEREG
jgi:hypothetical protein